MRTRPCVLQLLGAFLTLPGVLTAAGLRGSWCCAVAVPCPSCRGREAMESRRCSRCPCARSSSRASSPGLVPATRPAPSWAPGTQASGTGPGRARGLALPSRSGRMKDTSSAFSFVLHLFAASTGWAAPRGWLRASPLTPGAAGAHLGSPARVFFRHGNTVWVWLISAHPLRPLR